MFAFLMESTGEPEVYNLPSETVELFWTNPEPNWEMVESFKNPASFMKNQKQSLNDSFNYQHFDRDCDETKGWINKKWKVATDDSHLGPTNLNGKVQKRNNFSGPPVKQEEVRRGYRIRQRADQVRTQPARQD